jgi:hypothetical protein
MFAVLTITCFCLSFIDGVPIYPLRRVYARFRTESLLPWNLLVSLFVGRERYSVLSDPPFFASPLPEKYVFPLVLVLLCLRKLL